MSTNGKLPPPPKGTKYLELAPDRIMFIWSKLNAINGIFDDYTRNRPELFAVKIRDPNSLWLELEDGNGVLYMTNIMPHLSATAHVTYWDRRLSARSELTMDCLRWAFEHLDLQKINLYLPHFAHRVHEFARQLGFRKEGRIRRASYSEGKLYDVVIFGITREEASNGTGIHGSDSNGIRPKKQGIREHPARPAGDKDGRGSPSESNPGDTVHVRSNPEPKGHDNSNGPSTGEVLLRDDGGRRNPGDVKPVQSAPKDWASRKAELLRRRKSEDADGEHSGGESS